MANWKVDNAHSSVDFKVQHLGIAWVRGQFFGVEGEIEFDPNNIEDSKFSGSIDLASISTGSEQRDGHIKSPDFFDVENYPNAKFIANEVTAAADNRLNISGELTIKDKTKQIDIDVEFLVTTTKPNQDGTTSEVAAFSGKTKLNREEFGLNWNMDLPNGKVLVGKEVELTIDVEAIKAD